jgi:DNA mismatch repair protein MutS
MTTPMLRQYQEIKSKTGDAIVFYRLGDFYEMFGEDALIAAPILEIVLTARDAGQGEKIPMCGVPYHAADGYLSKLVSAGYKVAICEQVEDPQTAKGIVKREVVRVVTPGTTDLISSETKNNFLAGVYKEKDWGLAYLDITTGDFCILQSPSLQIILAELNRIEPAELVLPGEQGIAPEFFQEYYLSIKDKNWFRQTMELSSRFPEQAGLLAQMNAAAKAAAGLWRYVRENIPNSEQSHILNITTVRESTTMILDKWTRRNLELVDSLRGGDEKGTLYEMLNLTKTAFGARLLRNWIQQPLLDPEKINRRLAMVEELTNNTFLRGDLHKTLENVYDLERLLGKWPLAGETPGTCWLWPQPLPACPGSGNIVLENNSQNLSVYLPALSSLDELAAH